MVNGFLLYEELRQSFHPRMQNLEPQSLNPSIDENLIDSNFNGKLTAPVMRIKNHQLQLIKGNFFQLLVFEF